MGAQVLSYTGRPSEDRALNSLRTGEVQQLAQGHTWEGGYPIQWPFRHTRDEGRNANSNTIAVKTNKSP